MPCDPSKPLANNRHESFAKFCALGNPDIKAYAKAGYKGEPEKRAYEIRGNPGVEERIDWLKRQSASKTVLTLQEKREFLALAVRTPIGEIDESHVLCQSMKRKRLAGSEDDDGWEVEEIKAVDKIKSIEVDNTMSGDNKPTQIELSGGLDIREAIRSLTHGGEGA